jgi:hypothetical protein
MNENPGFLVPSLRRLRSFSSLSMRNAAPACLSSLSYVVASPSGVVLYESEDAPTGANPAWMPMEWSTDSRCVVSQGAAPAGLDTDTTFRLQVFAMPRGGGGGSSLPRYFPAAPRGRGGAQLLVDASVALGDLAYLGFDLLAALRVVRLGGARRGGAAGERDAGGGGGGGGGAGVAPEAAGLTLDTLPINTLVFHLEDGDYMTPEALAALRRPGVGGGGEAAAPFRAPPAAAAAASLRTAAAASLPPSVDAAAPQLRPRHNLHPVDNVKVPRVKEQLAHIRAAEGAEGEALRSVGAALRSAGAASPLSALAARAARLAALRATVARAESGAAALEARAVADAASLAAEGGTLRAAAGALSAAAALLPAMDTEVEAARSDASVLRSLVTAKQLSLLAELAELYPIDPANFRIKNIYLAPADVMFNSAGEEINTVAALGYTAHCVALAAKYLGVPLRFVIHHLASRSSVRDDIGGGVGAVQGGLGWGEGAAVGAAAAAGGAAGGGSGGGGGPGGGAATAAAGSGGGSGPGGGAGSGGGGGASTYAAVAGTAGSMAGFVWPLHWKTAGEKEYAKVALMLLSRNVNQLLASQGIAVQEHAHILVSLSQLFTTLLKTQLPAG